MIRQLVSIVLVLLVLVLCTAYRLSSRTRYPDIAHEDGCARVAIATNEDDGTGVDDQSWYRDGFHFQEENEYVEIVGRFRESPNSVTCNAGLRFDLGFLGEGDQVAYARLRLPSYKANFSTGNPVQVAIRGALTLDPPSPMLKPPHHYQTFTGTVPWSIDQWAGNTRFKNVPLYHSSPDVASIVNSIVNQPGWNDSNRFLILDLHDNGSADGDWVGFYDFRTSGTARTPAVLEVYKTVYSAFLGKELVGRVTHHSATVYLHSLIDTETYIAYGYPGSQVNSTPIQDVPAETRIEHVIPGLDENRQYYYRLYYKGSGGDAFEEGEPFTFSVVSDEHIHETYIRPQDYRAQSLYKRTLKNIARIEVGQPNDIEIPDFMISLGDFAHPESNRGRDAVNLKEATERYLIQREYIDSICHSIPFYLCLGNHEGELGWLLSEVPSPDDFPVMCTKARKAVIPNPRPNAFYDGNRETYPGVIQGYREDFYAWAWGDALFIVLDPFWYTREKPYGSGTNLDGWNWTLGKDQYEWLHAVLNDPAYGDVTWKFVFNQPEGKRIGWEHGPVHQMLADAGVSMVFHGHDHLFVWQDEDLDGIVYLECPRPCDADYGYGFSEDRFITGYYQYAPGDRLPNSGHIQVTVDGANSVTVRYIRSFLAGDGVNGSTEFERTIFP